MQLSPPSQLSRNRFLCHCLWPSHPHVGDVKNESVIFYQGLWNARKEQKVCNSRGDRSIVKVADNVSLIFLYTDANIYDIPCIFIKSEVNVFESCFDNYSYNSYRVVADIQLYISTNHFCYFGWFWLTANEKDINTGVSAHCKVCPCTLQYIHSILDQSFPYMSYCISAPWHGCLQSVTLLMF